MTQPNDGGPAFPRSGSDYVNAQEGMSLRDWFAGQALAGLMANPKMLLAIESMKQDPATCAYDVAEFMMAERAKR